MLEIKVLNTWIYNIQHLYMKGDSDWIAVKMGFLDDASEKLERKYKVFQKEVKPMDFPWMLFVRIVLSYRSLCSERARM